MNEIETAIQWLKENSPPLEDYGEMIGAPPQYCGIKYVYNDPCGYVFETAIEALEEKAERKKGCEYCKNISKQLKGHKDFGYAVLFEQIAVDEIVEINIDVEYCPHCGRKLGENNEHVHN